MEELKSYLEDRIELYDIELQFCERALVDVVQQLDTAENDSNISSFKCADLKLRERNLSERVI